MKIKGIDEKKCTGCGLCAVECVAHLYTKSENGRVRHADRHGWCTACGHCVAVCPADAIMYDAAEKAPERSGADPDYEATKSLLLGRRSVRRYSDTGVPKGEIEKILEVMRFAPSGHNAQTCEYVVIKNRDHIQMLKETTIAFLRGFRKIMRFHAVLRPFVGRAMHEIMSDPGTALGIEEMVREYEAGGDPIFYNAPVLVVAHVPALGGLAYVDPSIALTYGMLAAHSIGLGTCWIGFAMLAVSKNQKAAERLGVPKGRLLAGVMTLGYPAHRFLRYPVRNQIRASWLM
ncbi:MAG: nitroreductase family protein [Spirochaetales bacterium]|nr:nitroreductase family protein [Spirochaetales bacterium]